MNHIYSHSSLMYKALSLLRDYFSLEIVRLKKKRSRSSKSFINIKEPKEDKVRFLAICIK